MAYDPQSNPLDAISSEQKKRLVKNAAKPNAAIETQQVDYGNLAAAGANPMQTLLNVPKPQQPGMSSPTQNAVLVGRPKQQANTDSTGQYGQGYGQYANLPMGNYKTEMSRAAGGEVYQEPGKPPNDGKGLTLSQRQNIVADIMADEQKRIDSNKTLDERLVDMGLRTRSFNPNPTKPVQTQEQPAAPVATAAPAAPAAPALSTQQQAQDKARMLRQQISLEQQKMLAARRARGGSYGDLSDAGSLGKIQDLRNELRQYEQAGQSVQQAQTPEQYAERAQQFASWSANEMGNQIQKELTAASYLPEGSPQREAANARIQKMQEYVRQQQAVGEALPFNIPGPQPEGAKPIEYSQAVEATQRQQAMAKENMRRRGMDLAEAQKTTAKRELGEQREKDIAAAKQDAEIAAIQAPGKEQDARIKERLAGVAKTEAETKEAVAKAGQVAALTDATIANTKYQAELAKEDIKARQIANQYNERRTQAQMTGAILSPEDKALQDNAINQVNTHLGTTSQDESAVLAATDEISKNLGGASGTKYQGTGVTGSASGDLTRLNQINSYVSGLKLKMQKGGVFAEDAALQARRLKAKMRQITETGASTGTALEATGAGAAGGAVVGGAGGAFVGGVGAVPGAAIGAAVGGAIGLATHLIGSLGLNDADQAKVMQMWNQTINDLETVANSGSQQQAGTQTTAAKQ